MSSSSAPSVSLHQAALSFGDRVLWEDLSLDIQPGEYFAVLGPNGSGKSTFLKALLGLLPLSSGEVSVLGESVRRGLSLIHI